MTDTRNIAEVIGWRRCDVVDCIDKGEHWITDEYDGLPDDPTVDDLLAWLLSRRGLELQDASYNGAYGYCVDFWSDTAPQFGRGPTLLAAVEAAVRAVAATT